MALSLTLANIDLLGNRIYSDFDNYFSNKLPAAKKLKFDNILLKENTSMYEPVFVIRVSSARTLYGFNYAQYNIPAAGASPAITRYYYIKDIVHLPGVVEVHCSFDPLRNYNITNCYGKLALTNNKDHWVNTLDDTRFEPYNMRRYNGVTTTNVDMGLTSIADGTDFEASGVVVMKFWYGQDDTTVTPTRHLGICSAMMDVATFQNVIKQVNDFVRNNWGAVLSGVTDFTKFIYDAKFYPSLYLSEVAGPAGYALNNGFVIGGLCTINLSVYLKVNGTSGFLDSGNEDFTINILNLVENKHEMKFLAKDRWCDVVVETPVGWQTLPMNMLTSYNNMRHRSIIDFETGELVISIYKISGTTTNPHSEHITDIKGPCAFDVTNQIVHVSSVGERAATAVTHGLVGGVTGAMFGGGPGAAVGAVGGMISSFANNTEISQRSGSTGSSLQQFRIFKLSLKMFKVNTYLYFNPATPINDEYIYNPLDAWDGNKLQAAYNTYCNDLRTGYPSSKWGTVGSFVKDGSNAGVNTMLKFSDVSRVEVTSLRSVSEPINLLPEHEQAIKQALLEGIIYRNYEHEVI